MLLSIVVWSITSLALSYALICSLYNLLFSIASKFYTSPGPSPDKEKVSFLLLTPAYKEDEIIVDSVLRNLESINYPRDKYKLVVIADQLKEATISKLTEIDPLDVHQVSFEKSTKVKSLNSAIRAYKADNYDYVVILDADNVLASDFLNRINDCVQSGDLAIQGRRTAKNRNNSLSLLDGLSEEITNSIFRKGGNALGFSSPISGSGMAFEYQLYEKIMRNEHALGGFDKMLQVRIIENNVKIRFCADAVVFDEKIDNAETFKNQRKRWLNSHFTYFSKFIGNGFRGLLKLNFDLFNLTFFIHGLLPRSFNLLLMGIFLFASFLTPDSYFLKFDHWLAIFLIFIIANLIAIPKEYWNYQLLRAFWSLPSAFFNMIIALLKIKESNKSFIHTPHKKQSPNE